MKQLVAFRRETNDKTLITRDTLTEEGLMPGDVLEYLKLYPEDTELFHYEALTLALEQQEEVVRVEDNSNTTSLLDEEYLFVENPTDDDLNEEVKVPRSVTYEEEVEAFDKGLNPILEKELHLYLQQYQVGGYLKDYVAPKGN